MVRHCAHPVDGVGNSPSPVADSADSADWYCLHFAETNATAISYLAAARAWLDVHTSEIVVFWFSKHGEGVRQL